MSNSVEYILLGDIGATNARFALLSNGNLNAISSFEVAKFGQFTDVLTIFIKEHCRQTQIHQALLAIAGPVKGKRVLLTNSSWVIDARELQTGFGLPCGGLVQAQGHRAWGWERKTTQQGNNPSLARYPNSAIAVKFLARAAAPAAWRCSPRSVASHRA